MEKKGPRHEPLYILDFDITYVNCKVSRLIQRQKTGALERSSFTKRNPRKPFFLVVRAGYTRFCQEFFGMMTEASPNMCMYM